MRKEEVLFWGRRHGNARMGFSHADGYMATFVLSHILHKRVNTSFVCKIITVTNGGLPSAR